MTIPEIKLNNREIFTWSVLFLIGLGFLALIMALSGVFYPVMIHAYATIGIVILAYVLFVNRKNSIIATDNLLALVIILSVVGLFSYFTYPTVFSGRDQGSLSEAAIRLVQNHQLKFSNPASQEFFKIYGQGKALNFPGFSYTADGQLLTQFPPGYVSWLAAFYSLFGLNGLVLANIMAFLVFCLSFFALCRRYFTREIAYFALLLALSSFIFSWFLKFTLSENLALMLVWFGIWQFVSFMDSKSRLNLVAVLLSFGLLIFSRVEALAFFLIVLGLLYRHSKKADTGKMIDKKILFLIGGIAGLFIANLLINSQTYIEFAKNVARPYLSQGQVSDQLGLWAEFLYVNKVFMTYFLFDFVIFGVLGILILLKEKGWKLLWPFLIVSPSFIYLLSSNISNDHPWLLRRFLFSIMPGCIFYTAWFIGRFAKRPAFIYAVMTFLLISNLLISFPFLTFVPSDGMLHQTEAVASRFKDSDLVLVDRLATGDPWAMMSGPLDFLYGKQAVYFFNPEDISKLDHSKFSGTYLVVPDESLELYVQHGLLGRMEYQEGYQFEYPSLEIGTMENGTYETRLPQIGRTVMTGKIYKLKD